MWHVRLISATPLPAQPLSLIVIFVVASRFPTMVLPSCDNIHLQTYFDIAPFAQHHPHQYAENQLTTETFFMASSHNINVLITSFNGLGLPKTLCLPLASSTPIHNLWEELDSRLPANFDNAAFHSLILTTNANVALPHQSAATLATLTSHPEDDLLALRLTHPLCGGKGGFGSQLRAAGGRMSSKRKKNRGDENGSSRNLDGRRLRTVTEAKALAEYLAIKPEMEQKEKERRRERWTAIVEAADRREEEIRNVNRGRMDGRWVEDKEEASERMRDAVLAAMRDGPVKKNLLGTSAGSSSSSMEAEAMEEDSANGADARDGSSGATTPVSEEDDGKGKLKLMNEKPVESAAKPRSFFGFEEDDEFMSSDEEDDDGDK